VQECSGETVTVVPSFLDDLAEPHVRDPVADVSHDRQVVDWSRTPGDG
jgi:hypothetical protein